MRIMKCVQVTGKLRFHSPKIKSDHDVEESNTHTASYRMPKLKFLSAALRE
jgi:hypothetical protein